ncbi:MAG TPA: PASTA domain-containing protein [Pyrinomonadaceae bacterium]|nr:PASTA domain-containing protein [Pyrinomonadaceae bacterium]
MPTAQTIRDEQTGQVFILVPEGKADIFAAWISAGYSIASIAFLAWLLLDTWSGQYTALKKILSPEILATVTNSTVFRLVVYTAIGGGMGASINNLRSFIQWHAERQAFGWRFIWKYIAMPPLGAALAALVYGILQGGMAVFNGGTAIGASGGNSITSLSAWATGTLAGYGAHKVFIWLDEKVNSLFRVEQTKVNVPDVSGKSPEEAREILINTQLEMGESTTATTTQPQNFGKVIGQTPPAGTELACKSKVTLVIGAPAGAEGADTTRTDGAAKTEEEAKQVAQNGKLGPTSEESKVGADSGSQGVTGGSQQTKTTQEGG